MTDKSVRGRSRPGLVLWLAAALAWLMVAAPAGAESPVVVHVDQARIIKLPERAVTVVIGNPLIADLTLQRNGLAVITGKGYGATNVVVLDKNGSVLAEHDVEVQGPADPIVMVYRGTDRETYSCTPDCSRRITLGDTPEYFDKTLGETTSRNTQAIAAGASQPH
jgi:Pilus formation protein N terminal region